MQKFRKMLPVMGIAVFFGIVSPGSEPLGIKGVNLHE